MAKKQETETAQEPEPRGNEALDALVGKHVLLALGRPPNMLRVQVRCLWSAFYRVNVFAGGDNTIAKIVNSYFVKVSPDGQVTRVPARPIEAVRAGESGQRPAAG